MLSMEKGDFREIIENLKLRQEQSHAKKIGKTSQTISKSNSISNNELEKCGILKRYWHCTFEKIERHGVPMQIQPSYEIIKNYAANIENYAKKGIGLILKGPVGTMKTSLAIAVLQKYLISGGSGLFVPMSSLLDNLFTLKELNKEEWAKYEERIRKTGLLILDDLGAEYHQNWVLSKVDAIINERYSRMNPIVITSNLLAKEMKGLYSERIIDRLNSISIVVNFKGASLRKIANMK